MTKPREKKREELQAEIEDGKKKIRQLENREKVLRQKLSQEERRTSVRHSVCFNDCRLHCFWHCTGRSCRRNILYYIVLFSY